MIEMNSVVLRGWRFGREVKVSVNIVRKRESTIGGIPILGTHDGAFFVSNEPFG